jgi:hypothetical protein
MAQLLDDLIGRLNSLPAETKKQVVKDAMQATKHMSFVPLPGPQTDAYLSKADVLLYGGQAGGGKSFLLLGLASQEHKRSIIFRREAGQTDGLEEAGKQIIGSRADFNGSDMEWSWRDGRSVKLAGMKEPGDWNKHAGRERDFIGYDEAGEFLEEQVSSLMAWNRGPAGQRCRVVLASNPPRTADGAWMIDWFAPWLDENYPNRAIPGELRYAVMIQGKPVWQAGSEEVEIEGEPYKPLSFTFIPAALKDNPFRDTPEYRAKLNSLPEPLRSQLLKGLFALGGEDDPWQVIPTSWLQAAFARWTDKPPTNVPMCSIGADVAQGGADQTVLAIRHDGWYAPLVTVPGSQTPGGTDVAGLIISKRRHDAAVVIDVGGGWGGDAFAHLRANGVENCTGYMGVKPSVRRTRDNQLKFTNARTQAYWQFREALDPDQEGGSSIALQADRELMADLCAPRFDVISRGIKVESKEDVLKRLGRSPDKGDAVVMAWYSGARALTHAQIWTKEQGRGQRTPQVNYGPRRPTGMRKH